MDHEISSIIRLIISGLLLLILIQWILLIRSFYQSLKKGSELRQTSWKYYEKPPLVSVIIPTKNEELISKCLSSIIQNDYQKLEIIVVVDDLNDETATTAKKLSNHNPTIKLVLSRPRPKNWLGKTWACNEGYLNSSGEILLFVDSDTIHGSKTISSSVRYLYDEDADALSLIPRYWYDDTLSKLTIMFTNFFRHALLSPHLVNDPESKIGYFIGHFILIRRVVYEEIGTHQSVRNSLIEDDELGKKVKSAGYKIKLLRGEQFLSTLFPKMGKNFIDLTKRTVIPLYLRNKPKVLIEFIKSFLFLVFPFIALFYSAAVSAFTDSFDYLVFSASILCIFMIHLAIILSIRKTLDLSNSYVFGVTVSCFVLVFGYAMGILFSLKKTSIHWRGTEYSFEN